MEDAAALAALLVRSAPSASSGAPTSRTPNTHGFVPDEGDLADLVPTIAPDPADRHRLLVENPATCFDFP